MKRSTLILGAALLAAVSAPTSATAQSCAWWDLSCNGLATRVIDNSWHIAGRDQGGNVVYIRRYVDQYGNVVFEMSHRNDLGRYLVTNNHVIRRGYVYDANGERCTYREDQHGYKEECKYAKVKNTTFKAPKVKPVKYHPVRAVTYKAPRYKGPKVHEVKDKVPNGNPHAWYDVNGGKGPKAHAEKAHPGKGRNH